MYKLILYVLVALTAISAIFGALGLLPYSPQSIAYSLVILLIACWVTNELFVRVFETHANIESLYITAFILALIISPPAADQYISILPFLIWAADLAMSAKIILAYGKKHLFNPAAIAVAITALALNLSATWWIGTLYMLPFVVIGGFLVTRKIKRFDLVLTFLVVAIVFSIISGMSSVNIVEILRRIFVDTPLIFFATIMLTEPLTSPPTKWGRIAYGALVGVLFIPSMHIGSIYSTPELALCIGNILSFALSPKRKYILTLKDAIEVASHTGEFVFVPDHEVAFKPGQYMEWTLDHKKPDSRGVRRYFTIASSPTDEIVSLGVKFDAKSSTFKKALADMEPGKTLMAGQVAGDFTLPRDMKKKMVFIAGGIGITPFLSMIRFMVNKNSPRDVVLIYSNKTKEEIAYADYFAEASKHITLKTVYTLTDMEKLPPDWKGRTGYVSADIIAAEVPDWQNRTYYISGPHSLVVAVSGVLKNMGIPRHNIKEDYFPGFA